MRAARKDGEGPPVFRLRRGFGWTGLVLVLAAIGFGLWTTQSQARQQLQDSFRVRGDIASQFAVSYVADIFNRQSSAARSELTGPVTDAQFKAVAQSFGFSAAALLDEHGGLLAILPANTVPLGTNLAAGSPPLAQAVAGARTVSDVLTPQGLKAALVAFAVPFDTASGRRVFSGGFSISASPVATYLRDALPLAGSGVFLVDVQSGVVVADRGGAEGPGAQVAVDAPQLAAAAAHATSGTYGDGASSRYFVRRDVAHSPWRILMSVPEATLYAPLAGATTWVPWAIFAGLVAGAGAFGRLLSRLENSHAALAAANADLVLLARIDKLTGAGNRRDVEERLTVLLAATDRDHRPLSVLLIDVDGFKNINDSEGHVVGDLALQTIATVLRARLRPEDVFGRWGGDEFVVVLPGTTLQSAVAIAERARQTVTEALVASSQGGRVALSVSIGAGLAAPHDSAAAAVGRADAALYRAKRAGRNTVAA